MLPRQLYSAEQTRQLDATAIELEGRGGYDLMCRAGQAAFAMLRSRWPDCRAITVLCGGGNNGGDGYVVARLAAAEGWDVRLVAVSNPDKLSGDAARARDDWLGSDGDVELWSGTLDGVRGVIVDAMLGTGISRPVEGRYRDAVRALNGSDAPVLAIDIPSGISADSGAVMGCAVEADATVSFIGLKRGLLTGAARDHTGLLRFEHLDVPDEIYRRVPSDCRLLDREWLGERLPRRKPNSHKGDFGRLLVVGGDEGMPGSVRLTGEAALRAGAGLVRVATRPRHAELLPFARAELMTLAVSDAAALSSWALDWATVIAIGPGLGTAVWGRDLLQAVLTCDRPLVVDADGLNLLAETPARHGRWVLTPHPGEAARLLDSDTASVQADRYGAAAAIAERYEAVCVLKGAGTVVAEPDGALAVCAHGNPGMATAGMGDVLTGVIAALLGQGLSPALAARAGVTAHAVAGDLAAEKGERGLLASDVITTLREALNP